MTPKEQLDLGLQSYDYSDYKQTVELLEPLVKPDAELLDDPVDLVSAYEKLGLSLHYLGKTKESRQVFERLIRFRPDHTLNPALVPPKTMLFFEKIQADLEDELAKEREALAKKLADYEASRKADQTTTVEIDIRRNSRLVAAVPFGVGQFQNEDYGWGVAFLTSELVAVGLSAAFMIGVEQLRNDETGRFLPQDVNQARALQTGQLISAGVALGLIVAGIVHAQYNFEENTQFDRRVRGPDKANSLLYWEF